MGDAIIPIIPSRSTVHFDKVFRTTAIIGFTRLPVSIGGGVAAAPDKAPSGFGGAAQLIQADPTTIELVRDKGVSDPVIFGEVIDGHKVPAGGHRFCFASVPCPFIVSEGILVPAADLPGIGHGWPGHGEDSGHEDDGLQPKIFRHF